MVGAAGLHVGVDVDVELVGADLAGVHVHLHDAAAILAGFQAHVSRVYLDATGRAARRAREQDGAAGSLHCSLPRARSRP